MKVIEGVYPLEVRSATLSGYGGRVFFRRNQRFPYIELLFALGAVWVTLTPAPGRADTFSGAIKKGNAAYEKKEFDKALEHYRAAEIDHPESEKLQYNLGNALYKTGNFPDAAGRYEKALAKLPLTDQAKGYYNIGNALYREGKWEEAIGAYKQALELIPSDEDAKYNIEFVRQKIKENLKPQQSEKQKKDQKKQPEQQKQPQAGQNPDSTGEKKPEQQPEQLAQEKKDGQKPQPKGQMSKEDAERLLQAVKEQPVQKRQTKRMFGQKATDKDW